jgi:hypothetical protein
MDAPQRASQKGRPMAHASHTHRRKGIALALALLFGGFGGAHAAEPTATAIEYYNASLNHYFMTANPVETAILDANVMFPGRRARVSGSPRMPRPATTRPRCRYAGSSARPAAVPTTRSERAAGSRRPRWTSMARRWPGGSAWRRVKFNRCSPISADSQRATWVFSPDAAVLSTALRQA